MGMSIEKIRKLLSTSRNPMNTRMINYLNSIPLFQTISGFFEWSTIEEYKSRSDQILSTMSGKMKFFCNVNICSHTYEFRIHVSRRCAVSGNTFSCNTSHSVGEHRESTQSAGLIRSLRPMPILSREKSCVQIFAIISLNPFCPPWLHVFLIRIFANSISISSDTTINCVCGSIR